MKEDMAKKEREIDAMKADMTNLHCEMSKIQTAMQTVIFFQ